MDKLYIAKEELADLLDSVNINRKNKVILTAFALIWLTISILIALLGILVLATIIIVLGMLCMLLYTPFMFVDILLDKLKNKE